MSTKSNRCFGLIISGVGRGVIGRGGAGGCSLCSKNVSDLWDDVEEETAASKDWIGCNFKPLSGRTFMTATKSEQFCDPTFSICKNEPSLAKKQNRT